MRRFVFPLVLSIFLFSGCAEICKPKYNPTQAFACKVVDNRPVGLVVVDSRGSREKYFAASMFLRFYEPYVREYAQNPSFQLERRSVEILEEGVKAALVKQGYVVSSDSDTQIKIGLHKFLYTIWGRKNKVMAEMEVDVSVTKGGSTIPIKKISQYDEKVFDGFRQYQDGEPLLNLCLKNIIEKIVCDTEIRDAILR
jgi:uncharacterized lipoprotein YajG